MRGDAQHRILVQECSRSIWKAASIKLVVWTYQLQSNNGFHVPSHYMESTVLCIHILFKQFNFCHLKTLGLSIFGCEFLLY